MSQSGINNIAGGGGKGSPILSLTGNSGGAVYPTGNNVNTVGSGSITIIGNPGSSTLTTQLTGLTQHSLQVGGTSGTLTQLGVASNGQLPIGSTGADPVLATLTAGTGISVTNGAGSITIAASGSVPLTFDADSGSATPSANTITISGGTTGLTTSGSGSTISLTGTLDVGNGGTNATSFNTNGVVISNTTSTGALAALSLTDGQVVIGSSIGAPAAATLSAGAGIAITNGHNSITITSTGAGFAWSDQGTNFNAAAENGYFITATLTATLPGSPTEGQTIAFIVTSGTLTIDNNTGQTIQIGTSSSSTGGTATSNHTGDALTMTYRSTGATWWCYAVQGTWSLA